MKKITIITLLLLASCQIGGTSRTPGPQLDTTGTQGLEVVVNPASNTQVLMCGESNVLLDLYNLGTSDIIQGAYSLVTEDQLLLLLGKTKKQGSITLEGRSMNSPVGGFTQLQFAFKSENLPAQLEMYQTPFIFTACYPYMTRASIPVCIDTTRDPQAARSCVTSQVSGSAGQGAPVVVSMVEPIMAIQDNAILPTFVIHITNAGKGRVVSPESLGFACGNQGSAGSRIKVTAQLQDETLTCKPEIIDLRAGETKVTCQSDTYFGAADGRANQGTFTTPLTVNLEYGYVTTTTLPITITRLAHQEDCSGARAQTSAQSTTSTNTQRGAKWPPQS